jgi:hypothetical protein
MTACAEYMMSFFRRRKMQYEKTNNMCRDEGERRPMPRKSLWAIRKTWSGDVLVITTLPDSFEVFQRDNS